MIRRALFCSDLIRSIGFALVLPFLLLSLIAPGYMPVRDADGTFRMVICAEGGPVEVVLDLSTGEPVQPAPEDNRCDWAQMAVAGQVAAQPLPGPPLDPVHLPWQKRSATHFPDLGSAKIAKQNRRLYWNTSRCGVFVVHTDGREGSRYNLRLAVFA